MGRDRHLIRRPIRRTGGTRRDDRGVSSIELVLYLPLMFVAIFATVQFGLLYLGNSAAQSAARQTARIVRVTGDVDRAEARGARYLADIGRGTVLEPEVTIELLGDGQVRTTVRGTGLQVVPGLPGLGIEQAVQGPIEEFRSDTGP